MIVNFTIPDAIVIELNAIAVANGFSNAKQMVIAYLKAEVLAYRDKVLRDTQPTASVSDVAIS